MPIARLDEDDQVYRSKEEKYDAVIKEIKKSHAKGQLFWWEQHQLINQKKFQNCLKNDIKHNVLNLDTMRKKQR